MDTMSPYSPLMSLLQKRRIKPHKKTMHASGEKGKVNENTTFKWLLTWHLTGHARLRLYTVSTGELRTLVENNRHVVSCTWKADSKVPVLYCEEKMTHHILGITLPTVWPTRSWGTISNGISLRSFNSSTFFHSTNETLNQPCARASEWCDLANTCTHGLVHNSVLQTSQHRWCLGYPSHLSVPRRPLFSLSIRR